jgi:cell division protein FtsL
VAAAAPARARPQRAALPQLAPRPQRASRPSRGRARPRAAGGVVWIGLVALLLVGIVALNVAGLRLNLASQQLQERKEELRARNAEVASELSSLAAAGRIEEVARDSLGLVAPDETTYVQVRKGR